MRIYEITVENGTYLGLFEKDALSTTSYYLAVYQLFDNLIDNNILQDYTKIWNEIVSRFDLKTKSVLDILDSMPDQDDKFVINMKATITTQIHDVHDLEKKLIANNKISMLTESTPKTLYHGTLMKFVPTIMKFGLLPTVGDFTKKAYQEYTEAGIDLEPLVFAADKKGLTKCISAMVAWIKEHDMPLTAESFYKNTALIVIKQGEDRMQRRSVDWQDIIHHPDTVEPKDYYSRDTVEPSYYMTGDRLKNFFRRNSVSLYNFGIIDDVSTRQAERNRLIKHN